MSSIKENLQTINHLYYQMREFRQQDYYLVSDSLLKRYKEHIKNNDHKHEIICFIKPNECNLLDTIFINCRDRK